MMYGATSGITGESITFILGCCAEAEKFQPSEPKLRSVGDAAMINFITPASKAAQPISVHNFSGAICYLKQFLCRM